MTLIPEGGNASPDGGTRGGGRGSPEKGPGGGVGGNVHLEAGLQAVRVSY